MHYFGCYNRNMGATVIFIVLIIACPRNCILSVFFFIFLSLIFRFENSIQVINVTKFKKDKRVD